VTSICLCPFLPVPCLVEHLSLSGGVVMRRARVHTAVMAVDRQVWPGGAVAACAVAP